MLMAGVISVLFRTIIYLWGPEELRARANVGVIKNHDGATA